MEKSPIDLNALSKPATKLIEVVAEGVGALYEPFGTVRCAKADAEAMIIRANAEAEVVSIRDRAHARLMHVESIRQENIESITTLAANELPHEVSEERLDADWVRQYFNRAQDVSDDDMQKVWTRILAGEVSEPGSYSKRTLQFLETLDKAEAESFSTLVSYTFQNEDGWHILFSNPSVTKDLTKALNHSGFVHHFTGIGLISSEQMWPGNIDIDGMKLRYFDNTYVIKGAPEKERAFGKSLQDPVAFVYFTRTGQQLAQIAGANEVSTFVPNMSAAFKNEYSIEICAKDF